MQNILSSGLLSKNIKDQVIQNSNIACCLFGFETWSLIFRDEGRLRVFENRVLKRIFGPRIDEVRVEWTKLHNEKYNDLYCSQILFG